LCECKAAEWLINMKVEKAKGRVIALTSTLLTTVYNVFISGVFYTGFLTMYGMSITDTGILTFMTLLANVLSAFSPMILKRFPKRKWLLLGVRLAYYALYIVAITLMPQFVQDTGARLVWFAVLSTTATAMYSLFGNGFTVWLYNFYPEDNNLRVKYLTISQIISSVLSSLILIGSGLLTDALSNSPYQNTLILGFRYFAFVLVLVEVFVLAKAREYPYQESVKLRLTQVFTLPFRYKKFRLCLMLLFAWSFIGNVQNGLWNYHLLNHLGFSYSLVNLCTLLYTVSLLVFSPLWNRLLHRFSWVKALGFSLLIHVPGEIALGLITAETKAFYIPVSVYTYLANVGENLAMGNLLYMNLPEENATTHITFHAIGINVFAFLGLLAGTCISNIGGGEPMLIMGRTVYGVQFTCVLTSSLLLGLICLLRWRSFTSDGELARIEQVHRMRAVKNG